MVAPGLAGGDQGVRDPPQAGHCLGMYFAYGRVFVSFLKAFSRVVQSLVVFWGGPGGWGIPPVPEKWVSIPDVGQISCHAGRRPDFV